MGIFLEIVQFIGCVGFPYIGGIFGSLVVTKNLPWYESLDKPFFAPPSWVFGPAWGVLYGVIGLASYFVLRQRRNGSRVALPATVYLIHLALNWSWAPVFFGLQQIEAGIGIIVAITISAVFTAISFGVVSGVAGWLFVPYLIWIIYASALNIAIGVLNPTQ